MTTRLEGVSWPGGQATFSSPLDDPAMKHLKNPLKTILDLMKTHWRDLIKGIHECFPHADGSGESTKNKLRSPPGISGIIHSEE